MNSKDFVEALRDAGQEPQSYSGRGMYGKACVGVVAQDIFALGLLLGSTLDSLMIDDLSCAKTNWDSMGLDTIYYWPSIRWPEDDDDSDEDDEE